MPILLICVDDLRIGFKQLCGLVYPVFGTFDELGESLTIV